MLGRRFACFGGSDRGGGEGDCIYSVGGVLVFA